MPAVSACPDVQQLRQLLHGLLQGPAADQLEVHLSSCDQCLAVVQTFHDDDTLVEAARTPCPAADDGPEAAFVADLTERLSRELPQLQATAATPPADAGSAGESLDTPCVGLAPAQTADELGRLGPYRVLGVLGAGGMGIVYLAEDAQLQRRVALKVMKPLLAAAGPARQRFLREARAAAAVKHDHVLTIHHVGEEGGLPYLAMELLEGEPLDRRLRPGEPLPLPEVLHIGREIAAGLAAAHQRGLIHRDLKPGNIWLESRGQGPGVRGQGKDETLASSSLTPDPWPLTPVRVKLIDFGLARGPEDTHLTQQGVIIGTPAYMAPEQANGQPVDARGDLFSLGCVLYRLCTGRLPFQGTDNLSFLRALATDQPPPPRSLNPAVPPGLNDLIVRLLAKQPEDRPASAREVIAALDAIQPEPAAVRKPPRRRWPVAVAALVLLALAPLTYFYGGQAIRVATNKGELIIVADDPNIVVTVTAGGATIHDKVKDRRFVLTAGEYGVEVSEVGDGGLHFVTNKFTITRGGRETFYAQKALAEAKPPAPDSKRPPAETKRPSADPYRRAAEWAIRSGGFVELVKSGPRIHAVEQLPPGPFKLATIYLVGKKMMDGGDLENLRGVNGLQRLWLNNVPLTEANFERVSTFPSLANLEYVSINGQQVEIPDACLAHLRRFPKLRQIGLAMPRITDAGLKHLRALPQLNSVSLHGLVTDAGLAELRGLKPTNLAIYSAAVTDAGMEHLREMTGLAFLSLNDTSVGNAGLARLRHLNLQYLALNNTKVDDAGLEHLAGMKRLVELYLLGTKVTAAGVRKLQATLPKCQIHGPEGQSPDPHRRVAEAVIRSGGYVTLNDGSRTKVDAVERLPAQPFTLHKIDLFGDKALKDGVLDSLRQVTGLSALYLHNVPVGDEDVERLTALPGPADLTYFGISGTDVRVTDACLSHLQRLPKLNSVEFVTPQITDAGLKRLQAFARLRGLALSGKHVTDATLSALRGLELTRLSLASCGQVTDAGLVHLPALKPLAKLDLTGTRVTAEGLLKLQAALPKCQVQPPAGLSPDAHRRVAEWVIRGGGHVELVGKGVLAITKLPDGRFYLAGINLVGAKVLEGDGLDTLREIRGLRRLKLTDVPLTDADLERLAALPGLNELDGLTLYGRATLVTDAGLAHLRRFPELRECFLLDTPRITDAGLVHLRALPKLKRLALQGKHFTDAGLEHVRGLNQLTYLAVYYAGVSDAGLARLSHLDLETLSLMGSPITDAGLDHLRGLKRLALLGLQGTRVTAAGVKQLQAALPKCQIQVSAGLFPDPNRRAAEWVLRHGGQVELVGNATTFTAVAQLPPGPFRIFRMGLHGPKALDGGGLDNLKDVGLQRLWLWNAPLTDADLEHLAAMPALADLDYLQLEGPQIRLTNAGLAHLRRFPKLVRVELRTPRIGDAGLKHLHALPKLDGVTLQGGHWTNASLAELRGLKLTHLAVLDSAAVTDAGMEHVRELTGLTTLALTRTGVGNASLARLRPLNLQHLGLNFTKVDDAGLEHLMGMKQLTHLYLAGTKVTREGLQKLQAALPKCQIQAPAGQSPDPHRRAAEWALRTGGSVELASRVIVAKIEQLPQQPFKLNGVYLAGGKEGDLEILRDVNGLTTLSMQGYPLTDAELARLPTLPGLKDLSRLDFGGSQVRVTDAGLAALQKFPRLTEVRLSAPRITVDGFRQLRKLPRLRSVVLAGANVTADNLGALSGMPLTHLQVRNSPAGDAGLKYVAGLTELVSLDIYDTRITDAGLAHLGKMHRLQHLGLVQVDVSDAGLAHLAEATNLTDLDLHNTTVTDAGLVHLQGLARLKRVSLQDTPVTAAGKAKLQAVLPRCEILISPTPTSPDRLVAEFVLVKLGGTLHVSANGKERAVTRLDELPKADFHVSRIDLNGQAAVQDIDLRRLRHCTRLTVLHLGGTRVTDAGLAHLRGMTHLTRVNLRGTQVTAAGRAALRKDLPKCEVIDD